MQARLAQAGDLRWVRSITETAYAEYNDILDGTPLPVQADYAPRIDQGEVWLVARDGVDVGLAVLETGCDHVMIFSLAVLPEAQGAGVGRWMLHFVEDRARRAGMNEVRLYTNALMRRNIEVYKKSGYVETGRRPHLQQPGWVLVDMVKRVLPALQTRAI